MFFGEECRRRRLHLYLDWLYDGVAQSLPCSPWDLISYLQVLNKKSSSTSQDITGVHYSDTSANEWPC